MKRIIAILSITTGMFLGATLLRDNVPNGHATPATPAATVTPFNEKSAKLENERNTIDIVRRYGKGVVYVSTLSQNKSLYGGNSDGFGGFFGFDQAPSYQNSRGTGSGFVINTAGDILTNYHVVDSATTITVRFGEGQKEYSAKVIGSAPDYDLALIRVKDLPKDVLPMELGDSDSLEVGQKAVAMGAPFDLEFTVTEGIVSALARKIPTGVKQISQKAIQTDASINPGNSGGPLLNSQGQVIGINTQILSPAGQMGSGAQSAGVGFAIPINVAKKILPRLQKGEEVSTPTLGVSLLDLSRISASVRKELQLPDSGMLVQGIVAGSPADKGGIQLGSEVRRFSDGNLILNSDVIVGIENKTVNSIEDLQDMLIGKSYGDTVTVKVKRNNQIIDLKLTLNTYTQPKRNR